MIVCSSCGTMLEDDLRFCTECGTPNPTMPGDQTTAVLRGAPTITGVVPEPLNIPRTLPSPEEPAGARNKIPPNAVTPLPPVTVPRSNNMVLPIVGGGVALIALGAIIAIFLAGTFRNNNTNAVTNTTNSRTTNQPVNSAGPRNTPVATPTLTNQGIPRNPPLSPVVDPSVARAEVSSTMDRWADSLRRQSLSDNLSLYADSLVVFYGRTNVSKSSVQANRRMMFNKYSSSVDVQLSNVRIDLDTSGTNANVQFDNTYNWQGGSHYLTGKSSNKIMMSKVYGSWLIVGEDHVSQYYEDKQ